MLKKLLLLAFLPICFNLGALDFREDIYDFISDKQMTKCRVLLQLIKESNHSQRTENLKTQLLIKLRCLQDAIEDKRYEYIDLLEHYSNKDLDEEEDIIDWQQKRDKLTSILQSLKDLETSYCY